MKFGEWQRYLGVRVVNMLYTSQVSLIPSPASEDPEIPAIVSVSVHQQQIYLWESGEKTSENWSKKVFERGGGH